MALRLAIDANRYVDFCRGDAVAVESVRTARQAYMPFVVLAELRAGVLLGSRADRNETFRSEFLRADRVSVLFHDEATTLLYAQVYAELRRRGTPIPINDLWIAALAIQHDLTLLTRDEHVALVPRLSRLRSWGARGAPGLINPSPPGVA